MPQITFVRQFARVKGTYQPRYNHIGENLVTRQPYPPACVIKMSFHTGSVYNCHLRLRRMRLGAGQQPETTNLAYSLVAK
jgi:hypothetical protein